MNPTVDSTDFSRTMSPGTPDPLPIVSVVVPAYNEVQNIPLLYQHVTEVLQNMVSRRWELIIVDDGSRDATWSAICELAANDHKIKGVRLSRNFGHQYALLAGLEMAEGDAVITMDCDLQHPVEILPVLFEKWRAGFKVVKTLRQDVCDIGWFKGWTSRTFYRLFSFLSGMDLQPGEADFRLMDRQVLDELLRFNEQGLFLRGLTEWIGFSSCAIPYNAGERTCGQPQYNLKKMVSLAWKGLSSFLDHALTDRHPHWFARQPALAVRRFLRLFRQDFRRGDRSRLGFDPDGDLALICVALYLSGNPRRICRPHYH